MSGEERRVRERDWILRKNAIARIEGRDNETLLGEKMYVGEVRKGK